MGMVALLPLIIGAVKGKPLQGLAVAGQAASKFANLKIQEGQQLRQEEAALLKEDERLLQKGLNLGIKRFELEEEFKARRAKASPELSELERRKGELDLQKKLSEAEKARLDAMLKEKQIELKDAEIQRMLEKPAKAGEKKPKISGDARKAATFSVRLEQAEDVFGVLESEGFDPIEGQGFFPNRLKQNQLQRFEQGKRS